LLDNQARPVVMKLAIATASVAILIAAFAFARANADDEGNLDGDIDPNATSFTTFEDEYFGPYDIAPSQALAHASDAIIDEDHDRISITVTKFKRPDSEGPDNDERLR
jgi:hypothetical protein